MMVYQNLDEVIGFIQRACDSFGFHSDNGTGQTIGDEACEAIAKAIYERSAKLQRGGRTGEWPANSDNPPGQGYATWKRRKYGETRTNFRTNDGPGTMLSQESLKGVPAVTPHLVTMQYGLGRIPAGNRLSPDDERRTDIEKAHYAHNPPSGQLSRAFFELSPETNHPVLMVVGKGLVAHLKRRSFQ
jgi:hypothetical protein